MTTNETQKSTFLTRSFYMGLIIGAIFSFTLTYAIITITDKGDDIVVANCDRIPSDDSFVRRLGTDGPRTEEESIRLATMATDYANRFQYDSSGIADPNFKDGGVISACALLSILNSLEPKQDSVYYKFGLDEEKRTVLFLRGGLVNPFNQNGERLQQPLILFTGKSDAVFCPTHCGNWGIHAPGHTPGAATGGE